MSPRKRFLSLMLAKWWSILRREDNMNYTKPEVLVLGSAKTVIESARQKTDNSQNDSVSPFTPPGPGPAYDLDE